MAWKKYEVAQGNYLVDVDAAVRIIKSYNRAKIRNDLAEEVKESQFSIFDWSTLALPDLEYLSVDWKAVEQKVNERTDWDATVSLAIAAMRSDGMTVLMRGLKSMLVEIKKANADFAARQSRVSDHGMAEIERTAAAWEHRAQVAKVVRDTSASVLVGAATVMTAGGVAAGAAAYGSATLATTAISGTALKSVAKYQDVYEKSGDKAAARTSAAIEAVQTITFLQFQQAKAAKIVVSVAADTRNAYICGESMANAVAIGAVAAPVSYASDKLLKPLLGRVAAPVTASVAGSPSSDMWVGVNKKVIEDRVKKEAQNWVKGQLHADAKAAVRGGGTLSNALCVEDLALLNMIAVPLTDDGAIDQRPWW